MPMLGLGSYTCSPSIQAAAYAVEVLKLKQNHPKILIELRDPLKIFEQTNFHATDSNCLRVLEISQRRRSIQERAVITLLQAEFEVG